MTRSLPLIAACILMLSAAHAATVPSTGCVTDGQTGPEPAPANATRQVAISGVTAAGLAWYFQSGIGVLAPRGWHCLALSGSGGTSLYVTPRPLSSAEMLGSGFRGIQGPAVQLSIAVGDTSGRFTAARRIARLFPQERKFVDAVLAEKLEPASAFPSGPYPDDSLTQRGPNAVAYMTPARATGLGYDSWLAPGDRPITGVVILLDSDHSVLTLALRLPRELRDAERAIERQVEADHPPTAAAGESRVLMGEVAARLFVFKGKPIHPFCVHFPADSARSLPLSLAKCSDTQVVPASKTAEWLGADYPPENGRGNGYSSYRVLASKGDRFLIGIAHSGGGSGQFSNLLWVRLLPDQVMVSKDETGGDRCVGGVGSYILKGGIIEFDVSLPASEVIALSGVAIDASTVGELRGAPPDCDGNARYRYDPASERMQLASVTLNGSQAMAQAMAGARKDFQACYDGLVHQLGKNVVLSPADLEKFGQRFVATCASGPEAR